MSKAKLAMASLALAAGVGSRTSFAAVYTETYDDGTDIGQWVAANSPPRVINATGGVGGGAFLSQSNFSSAIPSWGSASPRYQPGFNDTYKIDSVFTGNWYAAGVTNISVDLNVLQAASWPETDGRPITLKLLQMDPTGDGVQYEATYTTDAALEPPVGWTHYDFTVNAAGGAIPAGWVFTKAVTDADGNVDYVDGTDADWADMMKQIDLTAFGYYAPGFAYPSHGAWALGIDNPTIVTGAVPEPGVAVAALPAMGLAARRRRR